MVQLKKNNGFSAESIAMFSPIAETMPAWMHKLPSTAQNPSKYIKFSENWNGKLNCKFFTSIRLSNAYFGAGEYYKVLLNDEFCYRALLVEKKVMKLAALPAYTAYLDTGYSLPDTQKLLQSIYSKKVSDWATQTLDVLLFQNIEYIK